MKCAARINTRAWYAQTELQVMRDWGENPNSSEDSAMDISYNGKLFDLEYADRHQ